MNDVVGKAEPRKNITTDRQVDAAKVEDKEYLRKVGDGLFLLVKPDGTKHWRFRFTFNGVRALLSYGKYPHVSLTDAKEKCAADNKLLAQGVDPRQKRDTDKREAVRNALTFKELATEWLKHRELEEKDTKEDIRRLVADAYPKIGHMSIVSLDTMQLEELVTNPLIARGVLPSAIRMRTCLRSIFAIARKRKIIKENPAIDITVPTPVKGNHAALTEPNDLIPMLRAMWAYCERGTPTVSNALIVSVSIFLRPSEVRKLKWENVNEAEDLIVIFPSKQKNKKNLRTLLIPMSKQVKAILNEQRRFSGDSPYIFPAQQHGTKEPYISSNTVRNAIINIGYGGLQTPHGFRATAATMLGERLEVEWVLIEKQLSHTSKDPNGDAYHRGKWLDDRRRMMQAWSDCLDSLRNGQNFAFAKATS